jgi:hypothetical protein
VCDHCDGWNLTPLDTRVDAIEECERVFRTAKRAAALEDAQRATAELSESETIAQISDSMFPPV